MKETISANVGGRAFTLDRDAYERLSDYLAEVRNRIQEPTGEVIADIDRLSCGFSDSVLFIKGKLSFLCRPVFPFGYPFLAAA